MRMHGGCGRAQRAPFGAGGPFGWLGGGPFGWPGGGPRARRGNVRAAILSLLAERPMHGYEMIQELAARTNGVWRPSAGSIYPTLQLLDDEGLVTSVESEGRRRYSLTDAGRAEAEQLEEPPWERFAQETEGAGVSLRDAAFQLGAAVVQVGRVGSDEQSAKVRDLLVETRRRVYAVLSEEDEGGD
jgi:DNA-binding PadR family transcriptional regulator